MIYIGNFVYASNQQAQEEPDRRHGEFSLVIESQDNQNALELFRQRIIDTRNSSDMFDGECIVYLMQLLEVDRFPAQRALMTNYTSIAGDSIMPFIGCTLPTTESDNCRIVAWDDNRPAIDGQDKTQFIAFGSND